MNFFNPKSLLLLLIISTSCFAADIKIETNEPESKYINTRIDIKDSDFLKRIDLDNNKYLAIDYPMSDLTVTKSKENLNQLNALLAYNLYEKGYKKNQRLFLYIQCPVTRTTYIDRSKQIGDSIKIDHEVLKTEYLSQGSYQFLSKQKENLSKIFNKFSINGKVTDDVYLESLCLNLEIIYLQQQRYKLSRIINLKGFGISE